MRLAKTFVIVAACVAALASCSRPQPSPQYNQARDKWTDLVRAASGDDDAAASASGSAEVLSLLGQVDAASSDAAFATELRTKIEKSRAELKARDEASAKMVEQAGLTPVFAGGAPYVPPVAAPPEAKVVAAPVEVKKEEVKEPALGMTESDFSSKFSRCFDPGEEVPTSAGTGRIHTLKDLSLCRDLYPRFQANSVLIVGGKVGNIASTDSLKPKRYRTVIGAQGVKSEVLVDEEAEKAAAAKAAKDAKAAAEKAAADKAAAEPQPY